jgi:hypothetical protein
MNTPSKWSPCLQHSDSCFQVFSTKSERQKMFKRKLTDDFSLHLLLLYLLLHQELLLSLDLQFLLDG